MAAAEQRRRGAGASTTSVSLQTTDGGVDLGSTQVWTWTYGGELPGKEIRVRRGDVLKVELSNTLRVPTTIHWHGIALRNDMDGVPVLTQSEIKAGGRFTYEFANERHADGAHRHAGHVRAEVRPARWRCR